VTVKLFVQAAVSLSTCHACRRQAVKSVTDLH